MSAPISVAEDIGMSITAGQVGLVADPDKRRSSADRDRAIVDGDGAFVVRGGTTAIFAPMAQAEPSDEIYDDRLADAPITAAIENGKFTALHFKRTTFDFHLPGGTRVTMTGVDAVTSAPGAGRRRMVGKGKWAGEEASFEIEHEAVVTAAQVQNPAPPTATTTPVTTDATASALNPTSRLTFTFKSRFIEFTFTGTVAVVNQNGGAAPVFIGTSNIKSSNLSRLVYQAGSHLGLGPGLTNLTFNSSTRWSGRQLSFDTVQLQLNDHKAIGALAIRTSSERPMIAGTLDFEELNLGSYFKRPNKAADAAAARATIDPVETPDSAGPTRQGQWATLTPAQSLSWWQRAWIAMRAPLARSIDLDIRLSAKQLMVGEIGLGRTAAALVLNDGVLRANLAEFNLAEGLGSGEVMSDFRSLTTNIALNGRIDNLDLSQMAGFAGPSGALTGRGDVIFDVTTRGTSAGEILRTLAGRLDVTSRAEQAPTLALDLDKLQQVRSAVPVGDIAGTTLGKTLKARIAFFNGRAIYRSATLKTKQTAVTIAGAVDLDAKILDLEISLADRIRKTQRQTPRTKAASQATADTGDAKRVDVTSMPKPPVLGAVLPGASGNDMRTAKQPDANAEQRTWTVSGPFDALEVRVTPPPFTSTSGRQRRPTFQ
ncbi:MAG: AsmA-like C-terminal region-containing protein [Pseudomonadota bacterium]